MTQEGNRAPQQWSLSSCGLVSRSVRESPTSAARRCLSFVATARRAGTRWGPRHMKFSAGLLLAISVYQIKVKVKTTPEKVPIEAMETRTFFTCVTVTMCQPQTGGYVGERQLSDDVCSCVHPIGQTSSDGVVGCFWYRFSFDQQNRPGPVLRGLSTSETPRHSAPIILVE